MYNMQLRNKRQKASWEHPRDFIPADKFYFSNFRNQLNVHLALKILIIQLLAQVCFVETEEYGKITETTRTFKVRKVLYQLWKQIILRYENLNTIYSTNLSFKSKFSPLALQQIKFIQMYLKYLPLSLSYIKFSKITQKNHLKKKFLQKNPKFEYTKLNNKELFEIFYNISMHIYACLSTVKLYAHIQTTKIYC